MMKGNNLLIKFFSLAMVFKILAQSFKLKCINFILSYMNLRQLLSFSTSSSLWSDLVYNPNGKTIFLFSVEFFYSPGFYNPNVITRLKP